MNILVYNRHFFPSIGGTELSGRMMARELAALGHAVTVVTATGLPADTSELDEGFRIVRSESVPRLAALARQSELVISRGGLSLRACLAAWGARVPVVVFHEMAPSPSAGAASRTRALLGLVKSALLRRVALHVVVSDALLPMLGLPSTVRYFRLYNPVAEDLWVPVPPGVGGRDLDVLFVGRLLPEKGLMVLRDALADLGRRRRTEVAIVGSADADAGWAAAFSEVPATVRFLGVQAGSNLRELYARARVVVVPSTVPEGMGMVAAEALANGTPVCASNQPSLCEVVGRAGRIHQAGDAGQLALDIERLLADGMAWQAASDCAIQGRMRFSMDRYRENLISLMQRVMGLA